MLAAAQVSDVLAWSREYWAWSWHTRFDHKKAYKNLLINSAQMKLFIRTIQCSATWYLQSITTNMRNNLAHKCIKQWRNMPHGHRPKRNPVIYIYHVADLHTTNRMLWCKSKAQLSVWVMQNA